MRANEKSVVITVNDKPLDIKMKLGRAGEAFFVEELEVSFKFSYILIFRKMFCSYFGLQGPVTDEEVTSPLGSPTPQQSALAQHIPEFSYVFNFVFDRNF